MVCADLFGLFGRAVALRHAHTAEPDRRNREPAFPQMPSFHRMCVSQYTMPRSRMSLLGFCQWLEQTSLSVAIRESSWGFPIIESVHALGLCLFGMAILMDLRVLRLALTRVPAREIAVDLAPWMTAGLVIMMVSGILVFLNTPVEYYNNIVFRIKVILLLLVAVNAWALRRGGRTAIACSVSLALWAAIILASRMITYSLLGPSE